MASLRLAMDAAFWDLEVATPQTLEGVARCVPGDPPPLGLARASRTIRPQQLTFLSNAFPLGIIPSFSPAVSSAKTKDEQRGLGSFSVQSLLLSPSTSNWWMALVGQFRPRKLISNIKKEVMMGDEIEMPQLKDVGKHFLDKSLYALGLFSQVSLSEDTSLLLNLERQGHQKGRRAKAMLLHKLPDHDVTLEAAWPQLFVDRNGTYWDVPSSFSLDVASLVSDSGLRYRFGLHKNDGEPEALNSTSSVVPLSLMPGICAKAAFSYEKSRDFWREKEKKVTRGMEKEPAWTSSYDDRLKEPHAAMSVIVGGTCAAWLRPDNKDSSAKTQTREEIDNTVSLTSRNSPSLDADFFGSLCYTFQHGKFKNDFNDLTRLDARLDISSASAFIKGTRNLISDIIRGGVDREPNPLASPRLNLILQQQVAGPIVFRVDSKMSLGSASGCLIPELQDVMFGLSYSFRLLESGKILAWYSPKRKEAMVELRLFEF